jgi:hypothetical protein
MRIRIKKPLLFNLRQRLPQLGGANGGRRHDQVIIKNIVKTANHMAEQSGKPVDALLYLIELTKAFARTADDGQQEARAYIDGARRAFLAGALKIYHRAKDHRLDACGLRIAEQQYLAGEKEAAKTLIREITGRIPGVEDLPRRNALLATLEDVYRNLGLN